MIVITGAGGFIGGRLSLYFNQLGYHDLVLVDNFRDKGKLERAMRIPKAQCVDRTHFFDWAYQNANRVNAVFHLGARTNTAEKDEEMLNVLNVEYSQKIWLLCCELGWPLLYASSAATYGDGSLGYKDDPEEIKQLQPLNPYGWSKQHFDQWVMDQKEKPWYWVGLKFFNVYGPGESHKGRMASVVYHAQQQIKDLGYLTLFRSHHPEFEDGCQKRDFIFVDDVCRLMLWLMEHRKIGGILNAGSGTAQTFLDLAHAVFKSLGKRSDIRFIDTPEDIRPYYQYYTQADMSRIQKSGYPMPMETLESGIEKYMQELHL